MNDRGGGVKLIVGLGNPGIQYQFTPHNLGFLAVDRIAEKYGIRVSNRNCKALTGRGRIGDVEVVLAKPETYMNLSGMSVAELVQELKLHNFPFDEQELKIVLISNPTHEATFTHRPNRKQPNSQQIRRQVRLA